MILPLDKLVSQYELGIKGILHIGAHVGQEADKYYELGIKNAAFFEPCKHNYETCKNKVEKLGYLSYNIALGNTQGVMTMYTETQNSGMSSSLLKPKLHLVQHSNIIFDGREEVKIDKLNNLFSSGELNLENFNLINMDVQGYELEVLKGSEEVLDHIDYIYSEVNRAELYENCAMIDELDLFLSKYGFKRQQTEWFAGGDWGDALFVKGNNV